MVAHREETLNTYKDNAFGLTDAATEKRTQNRFILGFVHIPKTAGTTVKFILRNSTYFRHCDIQPLVRKNLFTDDDFKFLKKI